MSATELSARRSQRERKAPTPMYRVLDQRASRTSADSDGDDDNADAANSDVIESDESESDDEEEEADERQFVPPKPKPRARPSSASATRPAKRKADALPRSRKLKPVQEEGASARKGSDASSDDGATMLFDTVKRGDASLRTLMTEWRDRYEENAENATREVLEFLLQACGGEGPCVPTTEPLDKLEMSDLVDYVVEDLGKAANGYPIASRMKAFKRFSRHFVAFWDAFVTECFESELLFTSTVVHQFVDWCSTLSSAEVRAIRHTSTVAAYAIGHTLVICAQKVSQQLTVVTRQLNADTNAAATKKTPPGTVSKKAQLLAENKAMFEYRLQQLVQVVNILFSGVVVHRYRDVMPEVRAESASAIGRWIAVLPDHLLKDNYLKYLGWMLNDKDALVRLRVVKVLHALYDKEEFTDRLELFTSRFLPRYLQLCDDVSDAVVHACVRLLIAVDKRSLINSDVDLQSVEKLVFELENAEIRRAAAEFVCLQYDAFGVAESTDNAKLKREQLNTQAIALVEFAEEYIYNHSAPPECVETVVEAFWGLDDCQVLQDWRLLTDLLLADKSAPDLTSNQQSILIRLLIASVRKIAADEAKKKSSMEMGEMTVAFCKEIPSLLVRYQSDAEKLSLVVELIPMLSLSAEIIGPHLGHVKGLLERLKHAFMANADETLLVALVLALHHLLQAEHEVVKRETEVTIHEIVHDVIEQVQRALEDDARVFENDRGSDDSIAPNQRRFKTKASDVSDMEFALRIALSRLTCLIRFVNVREYLPSELGSESTTKSTRNGGDRRVEQRMESVVSALAALIRRRTRNIVQLRQELWQVESIKHTLLVLYLDLLWLTNVVFKDVEEQNKRKLEFVDGATAGFEREDAVNHRAVREHIERVVKSRAALEDCLVSVLEMHLEKAQRSSDDGDESEHKDADAESQPTEMEEIVFESDDMAVYVKESQRMAFLTFCDTRCLFVEKFEDATAPYDALHWPLPRILVLLTQMYFENEMESADADESVHESPAQAQGQQQHDDPQQPPRVSEARKAELLLALGRVSISNPSNRRQSAAVLRYFTEPTKQSVEIVRAFGRHVKNETPVRYLEVQMTALRQQFNSILALKDELEAMTQGDSADSDDAMRQELQDGIESTEAQLKDLAKKLSQSLGVGKIAQALRAPFFRFVCEGVRFSLERSEHFQFLDALRPYLGHLDPSSMKQLRAYFVQLMGELRDAPESEEQLSSDWRIVFDFQSAMTSSVKRTERLQPVAAPVAAAPDTSAPAASTALQQQTISDGNEDTSSSVTGASKRKRSLELVDEDKARDSRDDESVRQDTSTAVDLPKHQYSVLDANSAYNLEQPESQAGELVETPVKRQRQSSWSSEQKSDNQEEVISAPVAQVDDNEDDDHQSAAVVTPRAGGTRKRTIASVETSEPRRTRATYLKQKQAHRANTADSTTTTTTTSTTTTTMTTTASATATVRVNVSETQQQQRRDDEDEIDSRRARRRRRSLLTSVSAETS